MHEFHLKSTKLCPFSAKNCNRFTKNDLIKSIEIGFDWINRLNRGSYDPYSCPLYLGRSCFSLTTTAAIILKCIFLGRQAASLFLYSIFPSHVCGILDSLFTMLSNGHSKLNQIRTMDRLLQDRLVAVSKVLFFQVSESFFYIIHIHNTYTYS